MKVDYRYIKKQTGCTEEQAKYLAAELRSYPKVKDIVLNHLSEINLRNCDEVKIVPMLGYIDNAINIVCKRLSKDFGFLKLYNNYKYGFDTLFPEKCFYEVY